MSPSGNRLLKFAATTEGEGVTGVRRDGEAKNDGGNAIKGEEQSMMGGEWCVVDIDVEGDGFCVE